MLEHTKLHVRYKGERNFIQMRKNFGWYIKNIEGASKYRIMLMQTENITEVEDIISQIRNTHDI
jgi:tRNA-dihydrouridine synthase